MAQDSEPNSGALTELIERRMQELGKDDRAMASAVRIGLENWLKYRRGEIRRIHKKTLDRIAAALYVQPEELGALTMGQRAGATATRGRAEEPKGGADTSRFLEQRAQALESDERRYRAEAESYLRRAEQCRSEVTILRQTIEQLHALDNIVGG
jgi:DNA-binding Xre family transcriptional regulator